MLLLLSLAMSVHLLTLPTLKVKVVMELHITATECHFPYGITQCYLPPDTSEHTPPDRQVLS